MMTSNHLQLHFYVYELIFIMFDVNFSSLKRIAHPHPNIPHTPLHTPDTHNDNLRKVAYKEVNMITTDYSLHKISDDKNVIF